MNVQLHLQNVPEMVKDVPTTLEHIAVAVPVQDNNLMRINQHVLVCIEYSITKIIWYNFSKLIGEAESAF